MPQINGYNYVLVLPSALFLTTILVPGSNNPALLTPNDFETDELLPRICWPILVTKGFKTLETSKND